MVPSGAVLPRALRPSSTKLGLPLRPPLSLAFMAEVLGRTASERSRLGLWWSVGLLRAAAADLAELSCLKRSSAPHSAEEQAAAASLKGARAPGLPPERPLLVGRKPPVAPSEQLACEAELAASAS